MRRRRAKYWRWRLLRRARDADRWTSHTRCTDDCQRRSRPIVAHAFERAGLVGDFQIVGRSRGIQLSLCVESTFEKNRRSFPVENLAIVERAQESRHFGRRRDVFAPLAGGFEVHHLRRSFVSRSPCEARKAFTLSMPTRSMRTLVAELSLTATIMVARSRSVIRVTPA